MLNASQDYALRMCAHLARKGGTASSKEIAEATGSPRDYLIQLAQLLRNAGIIEARPGKHGGYRLAKPACEISSLEIVSAVYEGREHNMSADCLVAEIAARNALAALTLEEVAR